MPNSKLKRGLLAVVLCLIGAGGMGCHEDADVGDGSVKANVREFIGDFAHELAAAFLI